MLLNLWVGYQGSDHPFGAGDLRFTNVYRGQAEGRAFVVGNAWLPIVSGTHGSSADSPERPGSICVIELPTAMPPLWVNRAGKPPYQQLMTKKVDLESEQFNRTFDVRGLDRRYVVDMLPARTMELLLTRDDWVFYLEFTHLVCVTTASLATVEDYTRLIGDVSRFVELIPEFEVADSGMAMPTLPDGTVIDPTQMSEDQQKALSEHLQSLSPEELEQFMAQMQASSAKFVAGMFGKHLTDDQIAQAQKKAAERKQAKQAKHRR